MGVVGSSYTGKRTANSHQRTEPGQGVGLGATGGVRRSHRDVCTRASSAISRKGCHGCVVCTRAYCARAGKDGCHGHAPLLFACPCRGVAWPAQAAMSLSADMRSAGLDRRGTDTRRTEARVRGTRNRVRGACGAAGYCFPGRSAPAAKPRQNVYSRLAPDRYVYKPLLHLCLRKNPASGKHLMLRRRARFLRPLTGNCAGKSRIFLL